MARRCLAEGEPEGYDIGRVIGAVGPAAIGVAAARVGLSDALALLFLPETRGKQLTS
jgi:hypothetical protein